MSDTLIIFSREWMVTTALRAYLAPTYSRQVTVAYCLVQLTRLLQTQPLTPVVLGLSPHEHVVDLYRLQPMLAGRAVLFVSRCFYWTDYNLPEWLGLEQYGFCSWDTMCDPFSRRMEMRRFRQFATDMQEGDCGGENVRWSAPVFSAITEMKILERANRWLYRELSATGLTGYEVRVLSLMAEGRHGNLPSRIRSLHKNNGLYKLGMTKHVLNLHRGVKVRPELQAGLLLQTEENNTAETLHILPLSQEAVR
ncbi:hypothetical protein AIG97_23590 [Salmonella enterica subsp. enterica serovar Thompson]|nr:hypothetical protein [Salmonella enterica subsp. enterica]EBV8143440.1 hypothetical protein [Salmonella enterica subsp. enterica serovar Thompson]EHF1242699.1 hypothetical protein [Salmonella enterica]EBT4152141.1 hypothetical protein [Salmonella enterica subsp. enterica]EDY1281327.1 hypothetical protein [Salmonella enterica subsp. enterica serovar Thompson]